MRIKRMSHGTAYVFRQRKGQTYAAVFSADLSDRQVESRVRQGEAAFFPYDPATNSVRWDRANCPRYFRR